MVRVTVIGQGQAAVYRQYDLLAWGDNFAKKRKMQEPQATLAGKTNSNTGKGIKVDSYR